MCGQLDWFQTVVCPAMFQVYLSVPKAKKLAIVAIVSKKIFLQMQFTNQLYLRNLFMVIRSQ